MRNLGLKFKWYKKYIRIFMFWEKLNNLNFKRVEFDPF
jgi:hypothetical protein